MVVLTALSAFFLKTRFGNIVGLIILAVIGAFAYTAWIKRGVAEAARAEVLQKVVAATQMESDRRVKVISEAFRRAEARALEMEKANADREELLGEIARLSTRNDAAVCLDPASVQRLQAIRGYPIRSRAGRDAGKPARDTRTALQAARDFAARSNGSWGGGAALGSGSGWFGALRGEAQPAR